MHACVNDFWLLFSVQEYWACGLYLLVLKVNLFRFQGQTRMHKSQRSDFQKAMEEAMLANNDILDPHSRAQQNVEGEGSFAGQEYHCQDQVILILSTVLRIIFTKMLGIYKFGLSEYRLM